MLIVGRNPIIEAIKFDPTTIKKIFISTQSSDKKISEIVKNANVNKINIEYLDKTGFGKIFNNQNKSEGISQGIAAEVKDYTYTDIEVLLKNLTDKITCTFVMLDEIQDPHNLGAIIRTCAATGIDGLILTEKNTAKVNHTVIKSSSGSVNKIKISQVKNVYQTIDDLKKVGFKIIGTSLKSKINHFDLEYSDKTAIVLGNEGTGLRKNVLKLCDFTIKIPIYKNRIESLNVSVATGVILYEIYRQKFIKLKVN